MTSRRTLFKRALGGVGVLAVPAVVPSGVEAIDPLFKAFSEPAGITFWKIKASAPNKLTWTCMEGVGTEDFESCLLRFHQTFGVENVNFVASRDPSPEGKSRISTWRFPHE